MCQVIKMLDIYMPTRQNSFLRRRKFDHCERQHTCCQNLQTMLTCMIIVQVSEALATSATRTSSCARTSVSVYQQASIAMPKMTAKMDPMKSDAVS